MKMYFDNFNITFFLFQLRTTFMFCSIFTCECFLFRYEIIMSKAAIALAVLFYMSLLQMTLNMSGLCGPVARLGVTVVVLRSSFQSKWSRKATSCDNLFDYFKFSRPLWSNIQNKNMRKRRNGLLDLVKTCFPFTHICYIFSCMCVQFAFGVWNN